MLANVRMITIFLVCSGGWCCQRARRFAHMPAATSDGSRLSEVGPSMQIGWYDLKASRAAAPVRILLGMVM